MKITVTSNRGFPMEATAKVFSPKNWLYLDFGKGSKVCIDLATSEILKGQSHCAPVMAWGEVARIVKAWNEAHKADFLPSDYN